MSSEGGCSAAAAAACSASSNGAHLHRGGIAAGRGRRRRGGLKLSGDSAQVAWLLASSGDVLPLQFVLPAFTRWLRPTDMSELHEGSGRR